MYDIVIVGAGFAGSVFAREVAERANKKVLILEKRNHIGGNMYDCINEDGVLIHKYGPHIFHTNSKVVFDYLSRFTEWNVYHHEVLGSIDGKLVPIPFNLNTLYEVYEKEVADRLKDILIKKYGIDSKIPILKLKEDTDPQIREIADYVYNKVFVNYTVKQWGLKPEEIDSSVTARVPVFISDDNRYFQDTYQGIPKNGYSSLFKNLLDHENITVKLSTDAKQFLKVDLINKEVYFEGKKFHGKVVYTGPLDELLNYSFGILPYRSLEFVFETENIEGFYQPKGTVNYPNEHDYTRITEFKHMTGQNINKTTIVKEYPMAYDITGIKGNLPFYPIFTEDNKQLYKTYQNVVNEIDNFFLLGRLAEYKYYNMDQIVGRALQFYENLIQKELL